MPYSRLSFKSYIYFFLLSVEHWTLSAKHSKQNSSYKFRLNVLNRNWKSLCISLATSSQHPYHRYRVSNKCSVKNGIRWQVIVTKKNEDYQTVQRTYTHERIHALLHTLESVVEIIYKLYSIILHMPHCDNVRVYAHRT